VSRVWIVYAKVQLLTSLGYLRPMNLHRATHRICPSSARGKTEGESAALAEVVIYPPFALSLALVQLHLFPTEHSILGLLDLGVHASRPLKLCSLLHLILPKYNVNRTYVTCPWRCLGGEA
jgi:hypothetical protein